MDVITHCCSNWNKHGEERETWIAERAVDYSVVSSSPRGGRGVSAALLRVSSFVFCVL